MVSNRCKMVVNEILNKQGLHCVSIELGEVEISDVITVESRAELEQSLLEFGFEMIENKRSVLIEKIKNAVIEMVHYSKDIIKVNFSDYLSEKLNYDYTYLANVFSEAQGTTIEHFIILHKIERVKELLTYDEMNISEIAFTMNYSSVAHLSYQFKKFTGLSPIRFKQQKNKNRIPIDKIGI